MSMSKTVSDSDLRAIIGYIDSYLEVARCERDDLRMRNYMRRASLLLSRLRRKLSK